MNNETKQQIVEAANAYLVKNEGISQNALAKDSGINSGYLSNMLRSQFTTTVNNKIVPIANKWFYQLAEHIGLQVKRRYIDPAGTRQFKEMIAALEESKRTGKVRLLIGNTGFGKSYSIDTFCKKNPLHTYRITVSSLYKLVDIITELCEKLGIDANAMSTTRIQQYSFKMRLDKIIAKLIEIKRSGGNPIIIIDEGENMEISLLKAVKALFDGIFEHAPIVMIGTDQLQVKLLNQRKRNRDAIPQLYRRFEAGLKQLSPVTSTDIKEFCTPYVTDKGLLKLLCEKCNNYGTLNDFLEPALKEADEQGVELTEEFFRVKYDMPKYS